MKAILLGLTLINPAATVPHMDITAMNGGILMDKHCQELHDQGWDRMDSQFYYVVFCKPLGFK